MFRTILAMLATLAVTTSHADPLDRSLAYVVAAAPIAAQRERALQECRADSPAIALHLGNAAVSNFCLVRSAADRRHALLLGTQLAARLDREGQTQAAAAVEALLDRLEAPADASYLAATRITADKKRRSN